MQFDRELACDLAVVSGSPKQRARYAECLIQFARLNSTPNPTNWGIDFASSSRSVEGPHSLHPGGNQEVVGLVDRLSHRLWTGLLAGFAAVEPSLGVLLSYAQRQIVQPLAAEMRAGSPWSRNRSPGQTGKASCSVVQPAHSRRIAGKRQPDA